MDPKTFESLTKLIRYYALVSTTAAGSGHPTSTLSAVEVMTRLYFKYLHYDLENPSDDRNDRVIFSKGHASSLFYLLYLAAGKVTEAEIMKYRTFDSVLEGHPTTRFPFTEAATGSLGQGLAIGVGEALGLRLRFDGTLLPSEKQEEGTVTAQFDANPDIKEPLPRVYVLLGDGEMAEGSVWEAMALASFYKLNNLVAIVDVNRLALADPTMYEHNMLVYRKRAEAFGWGAIVIDGHNASEIDAAYEKAIAYKAGPTMIIAKTLKGRGISFLEDKNGWHGKVLSKEELEKAKAELGDVDLTVRGTVAKPERSVPVIPNDSSGSPEKSVQTTYDKPVATRKAFGNALVRLGSTNPNLVVLDADVKPSTYTEFFAKAYPNRFLQCYIAEQTMAGISIGLWKRGFTPWVSTFSSFLSRTFDQFRMASVSHAGVKINGSHAGVSIGQDGASQMGLEDLSMYRAIQGTTVVYPSDPYQTEKLTEALSTLDGMTYLRSTRAETPVLYAKDKEFPIGGSVVHNGTEKPVVTVVGAGITLHEALKAQAELAKEHIGIRVIDCYSVKPIDTETLVTSAKETKGMVVVEDHYPEGGLGEAVKSALNESTAIPFVHLAVRKAPHSGKPEELLAYEEIDAAAIIKAVKEIIR
jgi:transketolase